MFDRKIRIGLLVQGNMIPAWAYRILEHISSSPNLEVVLVVRKKTPSEPSLSFKQSLLKYPGQRLFRIFRKLDQRRSKARPNALEKKDLWQIVECPELVVEPKVTKYSDRVLDPDIQTIRDYDIDVFIRMGFRILRGDILKVARYGVWSYHHGDNRVNRGGPAGTWEVLEGWNETGALLQILTEDLDGGVKLDAITIQTNKKSIVKNRNTLYWKASGMLPRKLEELHRLGESKFFERLDKVNSAPSYYYNRLYKMPTNAQMIPIFWAYYVAKVKNKIRKRFYFNQWILLYELKKKPILSSSFYRFKRILPPKDRIWADPFIVERDDKFYIFIEELLLKGKKKGFISVIEMDAKGNYKAPQKVLETGFHLSYPFIFERNGEYYMIPESNDNKTIDLYKCTEFPGKWEFVHSIMTDVVASDTTLFEQNGKFWMFTNIKPIPGTTTLDELYLFYADDPLSKDWVSHPENPIITDVKFARPAGGFFRYKDRIFRPVQNNAGHYGRSMFIREVLKLTEDEYQEATVQPIEPNWGKDLLSTHTINTSGKLTVIDALIKRRK